MIRVARRHVTPVMEDPKILVDPTVGCPNCPFGKSVENPYTGQFGHDCYARIFLGQIDAKASTEPGLPGECPLRRGPITIGLRGK